MWTTYTNATAQLLRLKNNKSSDLACGLCIFLTSPKSDWLNSLINKKIATLVMLVEVMLQLLCLYMRRVVQAHNAFDPIASSTSKIVTSNIQLI